MSNIEIGEYFRTEKGKIHKWSKGRTYIGKDKIVKHSFNIEDLIEIGDIVEYIDDVESGGEYMKDFIVKNTSLGLKSLQEYLKAYCKVKSIVTHEMFKEMEYRVDE